MEINALRGIISFGLYRWSAMMRSWHRCNYDGKGRKSKLGAVLAADARHDPHGSNIAQDAVN